MNILIIAAAIISPLILFAYIYWKDTEKEPMGLLLWIFILGMLAVPCASFLSSLTPDSVNAGKFMGIVYNALVKAAIPEELIKFILLYGYIWNSKHFDEKFDGIVYASILGLGFASLENILYVREFGSAVIVSRSLLSAPAHFLIGVVMGYYFGLAKACFYDRQKYRALSLIVPIALHAVYDWLCMWANSVDTWFSVVIMLVFYCFVVLLWNYGYKKIKLLQGK